jgi:hypothetical protein
MGGTEEVLYVAHGLGTVETGAPEAPIWLVVVAGDQVRFQGGPPCEPESTCPSVMLAVELAGAVVSDESGEVVRMFTRGDRDSS